MNSALFVDAVLLTAVLDADLGRHRKIGKFRLLGPLGIAPGTQGTCTNGFGNSIGGDSYTCTQDWNPFQPGTDYPAMSVSGPAWRLLAKTSDGVQQSGTPAGTNCVGVSLGGATDGFEPLSSSEAPRQDTNL